MSALSEVKIPDIGDIDDVTVIEVHVAAGDKVAKDDSLVSLESDKATMDVPSPEGGTIREVKVKAGDAVQEGSLILLLEVDAGEAGPSAEVVKESGTVDDAPATSAAEPAEPAEPAEQAEPAERDEPAKRSEPADERHAVEVVHADFSKVYASPAVRRFARELGADLRVVRGTGRKGRILKEDVQGFVKQSLSSAPASGPAPAVGDLPAIDFSKFGPVEREALSRIQKISGPVLQRSWLTIPHVTQHDEADITDLEAFRQKHKAKAKEEGFNLTPLALVMKGVVSALKEFPRVNSSLDPGGEHLIYKRYYHLGVAVDTAEGLIVPVVRNVDQKGIFELARELAEVSQQARDRKLKPDQVRGASFTISSLGGIGGTFFTPIVNWPEVAILGVSRSTLKPVWNGQSFEPRLILPISFSYDHRVIDGAMAVRFTTYLTDVLSDLRKLLL